MSRRGTRAAVLLAALSVLVLAAAGIGGAVVVSGRESYPARWDPRVVDLVAFVERERGLRFKHPVRIDFLDDAKFRAAVTKEEAPDDQEKAQAKTDQATLRALGLLSGDVDLQAANDQLVGNGVIGLYAFKGKRVFVRGSTLDDERRHTLVHELTHVLQDQSFNAGAYAQRKKSSGADTAYTAVVEADASKVAAAWRDSLPPAKREQLLAAEKKTSVGADFKGVPEVLVELMGFPYEFGPDFLQAVVARGGAGARDRLFTDPPTTEEHILLPDTYLNRQLPQKVNTPALTGGEKAVKDSASDVGMLSLLVILAERIDFGVAWPAVQGWAGDAGVVFDRAGATCVRADVRFDEAAQADRFGRAFSEWAKGRPAKETRNDRSVLFESCDPGAAAAGGRAKGHVSGIEGLGLRKALLEGLQKGGAPQKVAECTVDGTLGRLGADRVAEVDLAPTADAKARAKADLQQALGQVLPGCR